MKVTREQSMLNDVWQWWMEGLAAPWPGRLRRWLRGRRPVVWAADDGGSIEFVAENGDSWTAAWEGGGPAGLSARQRRRLRAAELLVRLPAECALTRRVALPPEADPRDYVERRLEEFSPFPADQICFDAVRNPDGKNAVLVLARRDEVEQRLQRLQAAGLAARGVTVEAHQHSPLDLMPAGRTPPARRDPVGAALLAGGLVACAAAVAVPFVGQSRVLDELSAEKARLEARLAGANELRGQLQELRGRAASITGHGAAGPDLVALLADLTRAVPDHSWVRQMVVHEGQLTLHGESGDTADLIARLEAAPLLQNVRYESAITHDAGSGTDRFKLTAQIVGDGS